MPNDPELRRLERIPKRVGCTVARRVQDPNPSRALAGNPYPHEYRIAAQPETPATHVISG